MNVSLVLTSLNELQYAHSTTASDDVHEVNEPVTGVSGSRKGIEVGECRCDVTLLVVFEVILVVMGHQSRGQSFSADTERSRLR